jgi:radical SAM superfamily enzyme YgiQ (UPF0313 family)
MNVVVVTPGHPGLRGKSYPPALTAPYIAALATPYADRIKIYDLAVESIDLGAPTPNVALFTTTMPQSDHIFEIAITLKGKGAKVILGGPHATLAYDLDSRIKEIFDSVIIGEGEKALPMALQDCLNGNLQPVYSSPVSSLEGLPFSRLDLLNRSKYYSSTVMIGTRGCVHQCAYCCIRDLYGHKHLKRPVDEVIEEIKFQTSRPNLRWIDRKLVMFWDDNPACDLDWFHDLLTKMIPLKKWWLSQMCLNVADNEETVKLMKTSGCKGILVGLESASEETLRAQNKDTVNQVARYEEQAKVLHRHGVNFIGTFMYGFDQDTQESLFVYTPKIAQRMGMSLLHTHIATPYPHSEYYATLDRENRLITKEAKYYNGYTVVHRPRNIHPADLQEGFINTRKQFYSWRSILSRMLKHNLSEMPEFLIWNLLYLKPNHQVVPGVRMEEWLNHLQTL